LIAFSKRNSNIKAVCDDNIAVFLQPNGTHAKDTQENLTFTDKFLAESEVNWCPGLGTVLANDEIVNGSTERIYGSA
jgi:leucyl-tRNA synthetase